MKHVSSLEYEKTVEHVPVRLEVERFYPAEFPGYGYPPTKASLEMRAYYDGDELAFVGLSAVGDSPKKAVIALMEAMLDKREAKS